MLRPPSCSSTVAWPIQVTVVSLRLARRNATSGVSQRELPAALGHRGTPVASSVPTASARSRRGVDVDVVVAEPGRRVVRLRGIEVRAAPRGVRGEGDRRAEQHGCKRGDGEVPDAPHQAHVGGGQKSTLLRTANSGAGTTALRPVDRSAGSIVQAPDRCGVTAKRTPAMSTS